MVSVVGLERFVFRMLNVYQLVRPSCQLCVGTPTTLGTVVVVYPVIQSVNIILVWGVVAQKVVMNALQLTVVQQNVAMAAMEEARRIRVSHAPMARHQGLEIIVTVMNLIVVMAQQAGVQVRIVVRRAQVFAQQKMME